MAPRKVIIDTDPGVDDIMALLLALSASPDEIEVVLLSVTYGNVPLQLCLRNTVAVFHVLEKELAWRKSNGQPEGYETMRKNKPIVAVGPEHPLEEEVLMADYFHGADGLHNVHDVHPHLSPSDAWKTLFKDSADGTAEDLGEYSKYFTPSKVPSHKEILRILRENPADTVSIIAIGPLTNMALAAADDPETFLKVKELVVMGGCVHVEGNVTPVAEFNCYADAVAAARVYALTSLIPASTLPPVPEDISVLAPYPTKLSRQLKLVLCPLDITNPHLISRSFFNDYLKPRIDAGSPLAQWTSHFVNGAFDKVASITGAGPNSSLELHDPLTVWYLLTRDDPKWKLVAKPEDIRVETSGQWTRGMHVIDRRNQSKPESIETVNPDEPVEAVGADATDEDEVPGDDMGWRSARKGNRISRVIATPGEEIFKEVLMQRVFG